MSYFITNIPSVIRILSDFREGYLADAYLSMIAERISELKELHMEFVRSLTE